jgi:hypothetical protein
VETIVRPPHSAEALLTLATATYHIDGEASAVKLGLDGPAPSFTAAQLVAIRALVRERINEVGPLARVVLTTPGMCDEWKNLTLGSAAGFYKNLDYWISYGLTDAAGYVAPYDICRLRFLSLTTRVHPEVNTSEGHGVVVMSWVGMANSRRSCSRRVSHEGCQFYSWKSTLP